jgi:CRP/FNR family transcriptional regulator
MPREKSAKADTEWIGRFPTLARLPAGFRAKLIDRASVVRLPAGSRIFGPGMTPDSFLLLLEGSVRVQQVSENGREIVFYRVSPGESCTLTTACMMGSDAYTAEGIAETDVAAIALPRAFFDELVATSAEFRRFVFAAFNARISELFHLVEDIAFQRMDVRLAERLLGLADGEGHVAATHQQLATELGTAREVISRVLGEFQRRGWVSAGRGSLDIRRREALLALAEKR